MTLGGSHLFEQPQQAPLAAALRRLLLCRQSAEVFAALRLQVVAAVQAVLDAVEDDRQRPGQQARVVFWTFRTTNNHLSVTDRSADIGNPEGGPRL